MHVLFEIQEIDGLREELASYVKLIYVVDISLVPHK